MLGDGNPNVGSGPGDGSVDPTQPLLLLVQQLEAATSASIADPQEFIDDLAQDILELPPEERFERAVELVEERILEEFGSVDAFESKFPLAPAFAFEFFERILDEWAQKIAENTLQEENDRNKNGLLVLLAAVDVLQNAAVALKAVKESQEAQQNHPDVPHETSEQELYQLGSVVFAIYARLYQEIGASQRGEAPDFEALATDILYGEQTVAQILEPDSEYPSISSIRKRQRLRGALRRGALRVYLEFEISIARGAELAELTQNEFVELLENNGIRPEYGPDSVDALYSGPDLMDE